MGNETSKANAEASKSSVAQGITGISTNPKSNESDILSARIAQMEERMKPQPKQEVQPETDEQPSEKSDVLSQDDSDSGETEPVEQENQEETAPKAKSLDNLNIDELTDDDIRELAEKGKSGLLKRIAELTAKRKAAEEQLAQLKSELNNKPQDPLETKKDVPNPFNDLKSIDELKSKAQEVDSVIEEAEELLWNNEHMAADDVIATFGGREFTKADIRRVLRDNQRARKQFLPARLSEIQAIEQRKALKEQNLNAVREELEWMNGEDNDTRKQFESFMASPLVKQVVEKVPEFEPLVAPLLAYASDSIYRRKSIPIDDKPKPQVAGKPPSSPSVTAARSEQPETRTNKSLKDAESRFKQTGNPDDFVAMRAALYAQRKR